MTPREFAIDVVHKLQEAGFEALWAGGCVRDQLLGQQPKDYDVATSAHPDQIRELFGKKRTLPIGAAFGVITVLGPKSAGQIEVATFRRDTGYSDGRHPDAVEFTDAREDAIRRDFTINGMFFDPISEQVIDYVEGQQDLQHQLIRAIGNPHERIEEDKLRMLRGVRFAATFGFELEAETMAAIKARAHEIKVVSVERIGAELVRMLSHSNKTVAARLFLESELLPQVLPADWPKPDHWPDETWAERLTELKRLDSDRCEVAIAVLLRSYFEVENIVVRAAASQLQSAWRLTNEQRDSLAWISASWQTLAVAEQKRWSVVQPLLVQADAKAALAMAQAILGTTPGIEFCYQRLGWPAEQLDPPPFLDGKDLIGMGIKPGPQFKQLLQSIRNGQLDGEIKTVEAAQKLAMEQACL